mgnify:FL=1
MDVFLNLTHDIQESLFLRFNEANNYDTFKELLENDYEPEQKHLDRFDIS